MSRWHLIRNFERSLKRLRIDHIDIYYMHEWEGTTPVEEKMAALDRLVQHKGQRYCPCRGEVEFIRQHLSNVFSPDASAQACFLPPPSRNQSSG